MENEKIRIFESYEAMCREIAVEICKRICSD